MAWTPPSKLTVILSFILVALGLFILIELFYSFTPVLSMIPLSTQMWEIIGMVLVFLAWFLMFLGVRLKGL